MDLEKPSLRRFFCVLAALGFFCAWTSRVSAQNLTLRVVTYNIEADIDGAIAPLPGLIYPASGSTSTITGGVLEGIGEEILADGVAQPIDILALEETTSNPQTVAPIVAGLNAFYGAQNPLDSNMYALSPYQAVITDPNDGNGPNAMVYNTHTLQLLASVPVDPPGGSNAIINNYSTVGEYREVVRYEFAPAGQPPTPATEFYVYVSHYKSGSTTSDQTSRGKEAVIIRTNEATDLPSNACVLYVGDYNISTSSEASYQTILAATAPNGVAQGQGVDPMNPSATTGINWTTSANLNLKTEEDYSLHYRDDLLVSTTNIYADAPGGLALVASTYHVFGNNGTTGYENSVDDGTDTALNSDLAPGSTLSASQLYADLVGASDHLPVVADYTIPVNPPVAEFTDSPTNMGGPPLTVTFSDDSSGIVTNWSWNFGDGTATNTSTTTSVTHAYMAPGVYSVTETVSGPGGVNTITQTNLITVLTPYQVWQLQYFNCTTCPQAQPGTDADGTGQDNNFKYVAGLNPTNPASVFTLNISGDTNDASWVDLTFSPVVSGRTYIPLYSTDLATGAWLPLPAAPAYDVTNGTVATIVDTNTIDAARFYQVEITLP